MTRPALLSSLLLAALMAGTLHLPWARAAIEVPGPRPVVSEVLSDHAAMARPIPGFVAARNEVALAFLTLGRVTDRRVDLGDLVDQGAVVARLDPEDLDGQVRSAEAAVAAARAQFDTTLATAERTRHLATRDVASTAQLEQVENTLASAVAVLQQARSQLIRARDQQGFAEITAPFDGVVTAVWAEPGEVVQAGAPIVTLSDRGLREAVIDLTETELAGMQPGAPWKVWREDWPDLCYTATVDRIAPLADTRTRTRRVHLSLPPEAPFRLGALIRAMREDQDRQDLTLPASAILQGAAGQPLEPGPAQVWVVTRSNPEAGTVARRSVTIGLRADGRVDVAGLPAGTEVVTRGIHTLSEGETVARSVEP